MIRTILNVLAVSIAILACVGMLNTDTLSTIMAGVDTHFTGYMNVVMYASACIVLFFLPIVVGAALEDRMYNTGTTLGREFANSMHNVRNEWSAFFAAGVFGGSITLFAAVGFIALVC